MNEPSDSRHTRLVAFYDRVIKAVRAIDPNHILFLDGNTYATDFTHFPDDVKERWPNCAYAIHDYSLYGFPAAPEPYTGTPEQQRRMRRSYEKKREWMDKRGLCVWNGEWGPVYARKEYEGDKMDEINEHRFMVLKDQLDIYQKVVFIFATVQQFTEAVSGPFELVDLALQGRRVPRHGLRLPRHALHETPRAIPCQETPTCT